MGNVETHKSKFETFFKNRAPRAYCDDCSAEQIGFNQRQQSNKFARELEKRSDFERYKGLCSACGSTKKLVLRYEPVRGSSETAPPTQPQEQTNEASAQSADDRVLAKKQSEEDFADWGLQALHDLGFTYIGQWVLRQQRIALDISAMLKSRPALYAFVSDGEVYYIGKTRQALSRRLYSYSRPGGSQRTNIRINRLIKDNLMDGREIGIMGFETAIPQIFGAFTLNLPAGLEDNMIERIKPAWNKL